MTSEKSADTCVDCRENAASLNIRNRRLCAACFSRYVTSKVLKRMESYRFKSLSGDPKRRLFLPISGGVSSLVLLQVLDAQLQRQIGKRNRTAYDLIVARIILPQEEDSESLAGEYERLSQRFTLHTFLPPFPLYESFRLDDKIEQDLKHLGIYRQEGEADVTLLHRTLSSSTSATTRADLQSIFLHRLLVSAAKQQNCSSVLWGHSDSRLAAIALADVAKGRGGSVPSTIADGPSMHGINFNYPLRDLFKEELQTYAQVESDFWLGNAVDTDIPDQPAASIRNTSIDELLSGYINSQGEKYPSIMANVVRTAGKLQVITATDVVSACPVCVMPISNKHGDLNTSSILCYGCERMKQDIRP